MTKRTMTVIEDKKCPNCGYTKLHRNEGNIMPAYEYKCCKCKTTFKRGIIL